MFTDHINSANLLLHSLVSCLFATLVPFVRLVAPGTAPLSVFAPGISELHQIVAVDSGHVENAISVTLDDT